MRTFTRMVVMLIVVGLLFAGIYEYKIRKERRPAMFRLPPVTVTAIKAEYQSWQPQLKAVGSLVAVQGVEVASEVAGLVRGVYFKSGDEATKGEVLVQLDADADVAQLHALEAAAELAQTAYDRDRKQLAVQAVSQAVVDADAADLKTKRAQVAQQAALVAKKTIRAPFAGRLGISSVNLGQYLSPGDNIVTLQALDPLHADFYLPQEDLSRLAVGQRVGVSTDAYPGRSFPGRITAVNPKVDAATRNVQVEATIANPGHELLPGMYVSVQVRSGAAQRYLTLPQTVVSYNPYGDTVFVVQQGPRGPTGKAELTVRQTFITVGPVRGDQVAILKGVKEGELVVSSGQLKLRNGSAVVIDNRVQPSNEPAPRPPNE